MFERGTGSKFITLIGTLAGRLYEAKASHNMRRNFEAVRTSNVQLTGKCHSEFGFGAERAEYRDRMNSDVAGTLAAKFDLGDLGG